jgi:AcrR family transcriptional regulator
VSPGLLRLHTLRSARGGRSLQGSAEIAGDYARGVPRERTRRKPREQTRKELLDAAARVFADRGFHGASVEAVSEEAGYSTGALYSNFESKEELFLSLYEEQMERRTRELRAVMEGSEDREAGMTAAAGTVDRSLREDRDFFLLYFEFALRAARDAQFAQRFRAARERRLGELTKELSDALGRAQPASELTGEQLAQALRALSHGLALDVLIDDETPPPGLMARIVELTLAGVRASAKSE